MAELAGNTGCLFFFIMVFVWFCHSLIKTPVSKNEYEFFWRALHQGQKALNDVPVTVMSWLRYASKYQQRCPYSLCVSVRDRLAVSPSLCPHAPLSSCAQVTQCRDRSPRCLQHLVFFPTEGTTSSRPGEAIGYLSIYKTEELCSIHIFGGKDDGRNTGD